MRYLPILVGFMTLISTFFSCENNLTDFLDKPPGVDVNEDTIFSSQTQVETFIAGLYREGVHSMLSINEGTGGPTAITGHSGSDRFSFVGITDEGELSVTWGESRHWNSGSITATNITYTDLRQYLRWAVIRRANILLERIAAVPGVDQTYIDQVTGEALAIRAMNYYEMLKRYGGVPIIERRLTTQDLLENPTVRNTVEEVVNFIVADCDRAAQLLPDTYPSNMIGRVTKGVALMVKAKTLLHAASPIFNTATPYLPFGENTKLICYGNEDPARWQLAADAAKAVIDWAPTAGKHLITDQGADKNYKYMWEVHDNPEIILANKRKGSTARSTYPWIGILPPRIYSGYGMSVSFTFVRKYEKRDGTPQTWDMNGGDDLMEKYAELDPRFGQTVAYNGARWNNDIPVVHLYQGHEHATDCYGGHWQRKFVPDALTASTPAIPHNYVYRLADAYLIYAEALNEAQGPVPAAHAAVNTIRSRSGMPNLPAGLDKEAFRDRVRNERAVELAFEDNRFWDLTRWLTAHEEGVMDGNMWGLRIHATDDPNTFRYEPYVFEERVFHRFMYLHGFHRNEVDKGLLIQNPGW
ncbi:RagB/SusD family nutrient uptake outer membrane protein [Parapedobacter sp. 10938]|uniref:RagB/SusD family nutrient uptake outer membrane protein n=1 Tax=Parapedobacter flavus TaxID=3110225 RepID=UPI002DB62510|nr:RagB/SusD family nutrient uptake outer membrane protein [Parapedobacter sp. 10938]MEC3879152.1 RagB/SusD family nutrient uptake outer membrane protein [Parapedobacter sp. 10938]